MARGRVVCVGVKDGFVAGLSVKTVVVLALGNLCMVGGVCTPEKEAAWMTTG